MNIFSIIFVVALSALAIYQIVKLALDIRSRVKSRKKVSIEDTENSVSSDDK